MKKILSVLLALLLVCAAAVPALAKSGLDLQDTDSAVVKGTYEPGSSSAAVYSVDIAWGSMEFTYTDASEGTWNPQDHSYDGAMAAAWSCKEDGADRITVTNHSNAEIAVSFRYDPDEAHTDINGSFSNSTLTLPSAVGTEKADAPSKFTQLTLSGGALEKGAQGTTVGTVTVQIGNGN